MSKNLTTSKSIEHARPYVYALLYPNDRVFYIGKGVDQRVYDHEIEAKGGGQSRKCEIIREIWSTHQKVRRRILRYFDTHEDALRYESHLISTLGGLANIQNGRHRYKDILISEEDKHIFGASIARYKPDGKKYFLARDVSDFLGYITWAAFSKVLSQSIAFYQNSCKDVKLHFTPTTKKIRMGRFHSAMRETEDYELSPEAFYFIVLQCDSTKLAVYIGQLIVVRKAYCTSVIERLEKDFSTMDTPLLQTALKCNLQTDDLPAFLEAGYRGLYGGLGKNDIRALKQLAEGEEISNWMGSEELADNILRIAQTDAALKRNQTQGKEQANAIHFQIGQKVREFIINELGGTAPEDLPVPEKTFGN